jgi:hypothetical protein
MAGADGAGGDPAPLSAPPAPLARAITLGLALVRIAALAARPKLSASRLVLETRRSMSPP